MHVAAMADKKLPVGCYCPRHSLANDGDTTTPSRPSQAPVISPTHTVHNREPLQKSHFRGPRPQDIPGRKPQAESVVDLFPKLPESCADCRAHCQAHGQDSGLGTHNLKNGPFKHIDEAVPLKHYRLNEEAAQVLRAEEMISSSPTNVTIKRYTEHDIQGFDEDKTYDSDSGEGVSCAPLDASQLIKYIPPAEMPDKLRRTEAGSISESTLAHHIAKQNDVFQENAAPSSAVKPYLATKPLTIRPVSMHLRDCTVPKSVLYVCALRDYDADDETKISFCRGDIIAVLKRRESGWWIGIAYAGDSWDNKNHRGRGLFPSNHCTLDLGGVSVRHWDRQMLNITRHDAVT